MDKNTQNDIGIQDPPTTTLGILKQLGPGLIIAGSIVGSGELIATTAVGARSGFYFDVADHSRLHDQSLCQVEFGRYTLIHGRTTLDGLNEVPGPRFRVNWILWYWLVMFLVSLAQLGGIVGGVGQAVTISAPLTQEGKAYNRYQELLIEQHVTRSLITRPSVDSADPDGLEAARLQKRLEALAL